MKRNFVKALVASAAVALTAGAASAATDTANLKVKLEVVTGCTVNFTGGDEIDFGRIANLTTILQRTGVVKIDCNAGTGNLSAGAYSIALNAGVHGVDTENRVLSAGVAGQSVAYKVTQTDLNGPIWGDGTGTSVPFTGLIPAAQSTFGATHNFVVSTISTQTPPAAGVYTDTLTATVTYP